MPLPLFLAMSVLVVCVAGLTLALAFWLGVPFAALAFAALAGTLLVAGIRQWR